MENYSRELPRGVGGVDEGEQKMDSQSQAEELEPERRIGGGIDVRSSSVAFASIQEVAPAPALLALARTKSLAMMADAEAGSKTEVEAAATLPASLSPGTGTGSSDGQGTLTRTSSLPAGIDEDGSMKRKLAQTLEGSELKRRIERLNSPNGSVEGVGEKSHEMNATANSEKALEDCDDLPMRNEHPEGNPKVGRMNHSNVRRRSSGRPPRYRPPVASQGSCLPGNLKRQNSALEGTPSTEGQILSPAVMPSSEGTNGVHQAESANSTVMATASSSPSALGSSREEQQEASERPAARATRSVGDMQRQRMRKMPLVYTRDLPNGRRMKGILYKYKKAEELTIVCVCHGRFLTPAEFVEHAGGGQVANPLRHIDIDASFPL